MNEAPSSGSRWEPGPDDEPTTGTETPGTPADRTFPTEAVVAPTPTPSSAAVGNRKTLAAAGAGLLLVGGLAGFAVGHATGDGGASPTRLQQVGNDGRFPGGPPDGDRGGDGYGTPGFSQGGPPGTSQDGSSSDSSSTDPDSDDA